MLRDRWGRTPWQRIQAWRWGIWHIQRWRLLAYIAGAFNRRIEAFHAWWHPTFMEWCEMCRMMKAEREFYGDDDV